MARKVSKKSKTTTKRRTTSKKGTSSVKKKPVKRAVTRKKVSAIPKGYHSITPYLIVDQASKAIEFYQKSFGAKVVMRMDKPDGRVGHSELKIGDAKIMLADEFPEMNAYGPRRYSGGAVSIHLYTKNVDEVVKKAQALGAKIMKPIENMFYGDRSCTLEDPFGHKWHVSTHIEDVTKAQMKKRMANMSKYSSEKKR